MVVIRAILAVWISFSVAVIPATAGAAISAKPVEMSMSDQMDMTCCPCCNTQEDSNNSVACAIKCINVFGAILPPTFLLPNQIEAAPPFIVNVTLRGHVRSPPTHPPPV